MTDQTIQAKSRPIAIDGNCPRCGGTHPDARFEQLAKPQDEYDLFAMCPVTNQPVLAALTTGTGVACSLSDLILRTNRYHAALLEIASYSGGPEVTGKFDEPSAARIARKALETI